jgi:hypothetical protein
MMSSLVNREPAVFLQAVARTCTLESSRGETMVRLKTPKEQQQPLQQQGAAAAAAAAASRDASAGGAAGSEQAPTEPAAAGAAAAAAAPVTPAGAPRTSGTGGGEPAAAGSITPRAGDARDSSAGGAAAAGAKSASKSSRKLVPGSFVEVIDALLDVVLGYQGAPKQQQQQQQQGDAAGSTAMELDITAGAAATADAVAVGTAAAEQQQPAPASSAAPAAAAASSQDVAPLPADLLLRKLSPLSREVGIQAMVLRLLADYCLLFNNSVGLLLKRDSECGPADGRVSGHHHHAAQQTPGHHDGRTPARRSSSRAHSSSGGAASRHSTGGQQQPQPDPHKAGVVLKHIMRVQLVEAPPSGSASGPGVAGNASSLLQAVCIRSGEGRRRIINEVVATLTNSSSGTSSRPSSDGGAQQQAAAGVAASKLPYVCKPGSPCPAQVRVWNAAARTHGQALASSPSYCPCHLCLSCCRTCCCCLLSPTSWPCRQTCCPYCVAVP